MSWSFSLGNLAQRAANAPAANAPSTSDTLLPLAHLATGYPDEEASFTYESDGTYSVAVDLNLLAHSSSRTDAPTAWRDLLLDYAGTPGLSANPPDIATYEARTALRAFRPVFQDVDVLPGENMTVSAGLYLHANSTATGVQVRVVNCTTGLGWSGTNSAWEADGVVELMANTGSWDDFSEVIVADTNCADRATYRVIAEPVANSYDANTYVYVSGNSSGYPALYGEVDFVALIGHNLPVGADVDFGNFAFSTINTPSAWVTSNSAEYVLEANLTMDISSGPRPRIGELWVGKLTLLTRGIDPEIEVTEGDVAQSRVQGATGRQEVLSEMRIPSSFHKMKVRTFTDAQYEQYRSLFRSTKYGADPLVLVPPDEYVGTRIIHARCGPVVAVKSKEATWREFSLDLVESPFSAAS
jgi:hypothetical protein